MEAKETDLRGPWKGSRSVIISFYIENKLLVLLKSVTLLDSSISWIGRGILYIDIQQTETEEST